MVEKYYWKYYDDKFELVIGIKKERFENEGILQEILLFLNNNTILNTSFGRYHLINLLKDGTYCTNTDFINDFYFNIKQRFSRILISDIKLPYTDLQIIDKDFDKFNEWLIDSLTPLNHKRKEKIEKIQKNIKLLDNKI